MAFSLHELTLREAAPAAECVQWLRQSFASRGSLPQKINCSLMSPVGGLSLIHISARPVFAVVQVSALSVGLLALALLGLLRTDLIASWRQATPANAPDRFVINVQPEQATDFLASLNKAGVQSPDWFPMIRGRLVAINGREVGPTDFEADRAKRCLLYTSRCV